MAWFGAIKTFIDLLGGDSPGAQPFASFASGAPKTAAYTAQFGETVYLNASGGGFPVTLPQIAPGSKGSQIRLVMRGNPTVGGATPQNVAVTPDPTNSVGGSALNTAMLLSGHSTLILESDGVTDWIITELPACPSTPATFAGGNQTLTRQGPYTRFVAPAVLGADSTYNFSNTGAVAGDIAEVSLPTHDAHTLTVKNAATTTIATYANTVAGGGRYLFNGSAWEDLMAGNSTS